MNPPVAFIPNCERFFLERFCATVGQLCLLGLSFLSGCAAKEAEIARQAKDSLVGLEPADIRMCAGLPNGTASEKNVDIWMYEHGAVTPGGVGITALPIPWGGLQVAQPSGGYCRVQFRFVKGKITEVTYAGATDVQGARDAACAPIVRTCLERVAQHQ